MPRSGRSGRVVLRFAALWLCCKYCSGKFQSVQQSSLLDVLALTSNLTSTRTSVIKGGKVVNHPKSYILTTALLSALVSACGQDAQVKVLEAQVKVLEAQVKELDTKTNAIQSEVQKISLNDLIKQIDGIAYLTPGSDGYSVVKSDLGVLIVSLDNIQPYATGSKVTLRFGNLMAATINGLKAKLEWGSLDKKGMPINESAKSREVKFNQDLRSGSWSRADVVLEGIPPTELGFVRVHDVGHTGVSLFGR
jgi:outer membrane murein-binding lipoprotein Lpp